MGVMDIAQERGTIQQEAQQAAQNPQQTANQAGEFALDQVTTLEKTDLLFWMMTIQTFVLILILTEMD